MTENSNMNKSEKLGMPHGTANGRLKKAIMFMLVQRLGMDTCYRCGKKIETVKELSIEHIVSWEMAKDPVATFFDLDNIAFSHLSCNSTHNTVRMLEGMTAEGKRRLSRVMKGEGNPQSKLTEDQVRYIRDMLTYGHGVREVACMMGVSHVLVSHIKNGYRWGWML